MSAPSRDNGEVSLLSLPSDSVRGVFALRDNFGGTRGYYLRAASGALIGEFKVWEHAANALFHQMLLDLLEHEDPIVTARDEPATRGERLERDEHIPHREHMEAHVSRFAHVRAQTVRRA